MAETDSSPIKAKLTLSLLAGEVEVASSDDPLLWQQVLAAITRNSGRGIPDPETKLQPPGLGDPATATFVPAAAGQTASPASELARELGVPLESLQGAIGPTPTAPFLNLDVHAWAAWTKNLPSRGPGSLSPVALAATLLVLWFKKANLGTTTVEQASAVLTHVGVAAQNPTRSIRNCRWLQIRNTSDVLLNPARVADAVAVAKAFCRHEKPQLAE